MVPEIPAKHAAAFTKVEPSKPEPDDPDLLPVKHTFIHFPDTDGPSSVGQQWSSTPPVMMRCDHHTKYPNMEAAHMAGTCHPCFYNLKKADGCRKGADCEFCHLCPQGSVQKKRKAEGLPVASSCRRPSHLNVDTFKDCREVGRFE